jgi:FixJ family two-component response regulator
VILDRLTDRQKSILRRLCAGQRNEEIAEADGVPPWSIKYQRERIMLRSPKGMTLSDVCALAALEDPTFHAIYAPALGRPAAPTGPR